MKAHRWRALLALGLSISVVAAACGDDDDGGGGATTTTAAEDGGTDGGGDGTAAPGDGLVIGRVLPETGDLAFLGPPMIEAVRLAIEDIQAAGGQVTLIERDSGTDPDVATEAVNALLGEGAHVIMGAAASGVSQAFIQTLSDNQIPQCSPANTSPAFTDQENADFYFRTVPPDNAVAPVIADAVSGDGATNVAVVARADDYGNALAELVAEELQALGAEATIISYNPESPSTDDVVNEVTGIDPDGVVVISFNEGGPIIQGMLEAGVPADIMYGSDGIFFPGLADEVGVEPTELEGMKLIGASGGTEFNQRLTELTQGNLIYGGQSYDCIIVLQLAFEAAGTTDGPAIMEQVGAVTNDGEVCTTYAECSALLAEGADIDYDGVSGPLNLDDVGDPTFGRYAVAEFQGGELVPIDEVDVDLAEL